MKPRRTVSWRTTARDDALIARIVERAARELPADQLGVFGTFGRRELMMDLVATHANGCPLRLADLLAADEVTFAHDVLGIRVFIDRTTGRLTHYFVPRCARSHADPTALPAARRASAR